MIYLILIILFLTIILYILYKDYLRVLKVSSIVTGISGMLTLIIGYLMKFFINGQVSFINISKITNLILVKFLRNSIYLLIFSLIELILYFVINYYFRRKKLVSA